MKLESPSISDKTNVYNGFASWLAGAKMSVAGGLVFALRSWASSSGLVSLPADRVGNASPAEWAIKSSARPNPYGVEGWWNDKTESLRVGLVACGETGKSDPHETNEAVRFCGRGKLVSGAGPHSTDAQMDVPGL